MKSDSKSTSIKKPVLYFLVSVVLILVAAVLLLLVKVFTQQNAISSSLTPEVGDCYNLSQEELDSLTPLSKPVDCESSHNSETYRVGEWTETLSPWKMPVAEITASAEKVCIPWNLPENTSLNYWFFYLPNESDWDSGARWIRCDAANQITDDKGNKSFGTWEGTKSSTNNSTQSETSGLIALLQNESGFTWQKSEDDAKWFSGEAQVYITVEPYGECGIYIFNNQDTAERWTNETSFSSNAYQAWIGTYQASGEGVILKASFEEAQCGMKTAELLGWKPLDTEDTNYLPGGNPFELCVYSSLRVYGGSAQDAIGACKYQFERDGKPVPDGY